MGIKDFFKRYKGMGLRYIPKTLIRELRYAFQRFWRGYDDVDVFSIYDRFNERMIVTLKQFLKHNNGIWSTPKKQLTKSETDAIIEKMLYYFEHSDIDGWKELDLDPSKVEDREAIEKISVQATLNQNAALKMFQKWFYDLWY